MRKLATAAFSFAAAIFLSRYLLPYSFLPVFGAAAAACAFSGFLFSGNKRIRVFIVLLSLSAGFFWSLTYTAVFIAPSWDLHEQTEDMTAVVTDHPSERARGFRVDVIIRRQNSPSVGARLYYFNESALKPGDVIEFTARFKRTDGLGDGDRFDALSSRGAFLSGYVSGNITVTGAEGRFRYMPKRLAETVAEMIDTIFPSDISPFMRALLVGKRDALNQQAAVTATLSASGIIHVVAISGMHVSFLMGFLGVIVRSKRAFAFVGIPLLFLFMAMTGFTPSVSRAGIMQVFLICAPVFKRESDSITSLSASLLVLLAVNPYSCASVGLQLSFSATLGIILLTGRINSGVSDYLRGTALHRKKTLRLAVGFITSNLATTVGALVFSLPLTVAHFGYVSLVSPLTNLLTLWAVSLAFALGLAVCLLGFIILPLGFIAAFPVAYAARYILMIARALAAVPYSVIYLYNKHIIFWLVYIYAMFIFMPLMRARARQYLYPACLSILTLVAVILLSPLLPGARDTAVTVLDVGQGLSVVMTSGKHTAMVDCGSNSGENAGAIAHEYLINQGRTVVDLLVLTHFHSDHVNGVEFLLSRTHVAALAIPDPEGSYLAEDIIELARKRGTDIIYITEVFSASLGDTIVLLYPPVGYGGENERGLSVLAMGGVTALITGDLNASVERSLLRAVDLPKTDMIVVGHHGSKHSASEELLAAVSPDIAVISVGKNSFGHPAGETLQRLTDFSVTIYRTDQMGHVTVGGR